MKRTPMGDTIRLNMPKRQGVNLASLVAALLWLLTCAVIAGCVTVGVLMAMGAVQW